MRTAQYPQHIWNFTTASGATMQQTSCTTKQVCHRSTRTTRIPTYANVHSTLCRIASRCTQRLTGCPCVLVRVPSGANSCGKCREKKSVPCREMARQLDARQYFSVHVYSCAIDRHSNTGRAVALLRQDSSGHQRWCLSVASLCSCFDSDILDALRLLCRAHRQTVQCSTTE